MLLRHRQLARLPEQADVLQHRQHQPFECQFHGRLLERFQCEVSRFAAPVCQQQFQKITLFCYQRRYGFDSLWKAGENDPAVRVEGVPTGPVPVQPSTWGQIKSLYK